MNLLYPVTTLAIGCMTVLTLDASRPRTTQDPSATARPSDEIAALRASIQTLKVAGERRDEALRQLDDKTNTHHKTLTAFATLPIGSIVPWIGAEDALDGTGWVLCNATNAKTMSVPDLEGRFLQGWGAEAVGSTGGKKAIDAGGAHNHGGWTRGLSYMPGEINFPRGRGQHDEFSHKHVIDADGTHDHGGENRPPYYTVRYIIRVR